jgi:hypothetical protein
VRNVIDANIRRPTRGSRDLGLISGNTLAPIEDSGNANPDSTLGYDAHIARTGGGYFFNLSMKGLATGQYVLSFYWEASDRFYTVSLK